jgi:hypothetical protein
VHDHANVRVDVHVIVDVVGFDRAREASFAKFCPGGTKI